MKAKRLVPMMVAPLLGLVVALALMLTAGQNARANPTTVYVDRDALGLTHDGLSWTTAFTNVQSALVIALPHNEIWIATGVYTPGQVITFTVVITNTGPGLTNGLISDTLPAGLNFLGPIVLDPPDTGVVGIVPPMLASSLIISAHRQVTLTFPVSISLSLVGGTPITNTAWLTSAEVVTPKSASLTITIMEARYLTYLPLVMRDYQ